MKSDSVYKRAFNDALTMLQRGDFSSGLPSENQLRSQIGVSRTTIRKVLAELDLRGITGSRGGRRLGQRQVVENDFYGEAETTSRNAHVEQQFMEWMLRGDAKPGTLINELELARQFGVATNGIREFLIRFSRFGLVQKKSNSGWIFNGLTETFALELFEVRMMFELRSARLFAQLPESSPHWARLEALRRQHLDLLDSVEARFHDFSALDNRLHRLIGESAPNRFIADFADLITFIFHYHYQWNKTDELARNKAAIIEHLAYIDALQSRDSRKIERSCRAHLKSAKTTLLRSLVG